MSYFPLSLRFDDKNVLLIGGGKIAAFKLKKIKQFYPSSLICIARNFDPEFIAESEVFHTLIQKDFQMKDLDGIDLVIVAIDDVAVQEAIYKTCRENKILCNCVDLLHCCDFIFPSIIKRGEITVAITSNGKVPGFSAVFKEYLEKMIPDSLESGFAEVLKLRQTLAPGAGRMKLIREKAQQFFDKEIKNKGEVSEY